MGAHTASPLVDFQLDFINRETMERAGRRGRRDLTGLVIMLLINIAVHHLASALADQQTSGQSDIGCREFRQVYMYITGWWIMENRVVQFTGKKDLSQWIIYLEPTREKYRPKDKLDRRLSVFLQKDTGFGSNVYNRILLHVQYLTLSSKASSFVPKVFDVRGLSREGVTTAYQ